MNITCVTEHELEKFQQRWLRVVESDYDGMDESILDTVRLINAIPGVATAWSCAGHPERGEFQPGHVTMVCSERGLDEVQ